MHILTHLHTPNSINHEYVYLPNTLASASVSLFDHKAEKQRVGQKEEKVKEGMRKSPKAFIFQKSIIRLVLWEAKMKTTVFWKKNSQCTLLLGGEVFSSFQQFKGSRNMNIRT